MKMKAPRTRSALCLSGRTLLPALLLLSSASLAYGRPAKSAAAKHKDAADQAATSSTDAPSVRLAADTPGNSPLAAPGPSLLAGSSPEMSSDVAGKSAPSSGSVEDAAKAGSSPAASEDMAGVAEQAPSWVEHLGPGSFPGKTRGLVGGSLWLEPSFHGLQWPYMTRTGVGISGAAWVDSGYERITRGPASPDTASGLQQGRIVVRVTPTYASGNFFIQSQIEVVGNQCQNAGTACVNSGVVDTDDLWIRVGHWNVWDLKVGRFEGWELYHTGMGLDVNTLERKGAVQTDKGSNTLLVPDFYGLTYLHDRPSGVGIGDVALHAFPAKFLRFELLGQIGTDAAAVNGQLSSTGRNILGGRPSGILDLGWLKFKAGYEYVRRTDATQALQPDPNNPSANIKAYDQYKGTSKGYGVALQFIFDPLVEFGANFARGNVAETDTKGNPSGTGSYTTTSVGGFANLRIATLFNGGHSRALEDLLFGAGVNWTTQTDNHRDSNGNVNYTAQLQIFGALQYYLAKQLIVKAVIAYARADFDPSFTTAADSITSNEMLSGRLRLMYLY